MDNSQNIKRGGVLKCPSCGASVSSLAVRCEECGHEFVNLTANLTANSIASTLGEIQNNKDLSEEEKTLRKIHVIQNFPVPNSREDLIEMLTLCRANISSKAENSEIKKAWKAKSTQIISKSQVLLKGDNDAQYLISSIKADETAAKKRTRNIIIALLAAIIIAIGAFTTISYRSAIEEKRQNTELSNIKNDIGKLIQGGEYSQAYERIGELYNYMSINNMDKGRFDEIAGDTYLKLVVALIREDALEDAAEVGLDYRTKLTDDQKWRNSQVFSVLVQECENQNVDDSPLR